MSPVVVLALCVLVVLPAMALTVAVLLFGPRRTRYDIDGATAAYRERSARGDEMTVLTPVDPEEAIS